MPLAPNKRTIEERDAERQAGSDREAVGHVDSHGHRQVEDRLTSVRAVAFRDVAEIDEAAGRRHKAEADSDGHSQFLEILRDANVAQRRAGSGRFGIGKGSTSGGPTTGMLLVCVKLKVGSAHAPPKRNCVPRNCVSDAGLALIALVRSCGWAMLTPAMPPDAGISVFCNSTPKDWALCRRREDSQRDNDASERQNSSHDRVPSQNCRLDAQVADESVLGIACLLSAVIG